MGMELPLNRLHQAATLSVLVHGAGLVWMLQTGKGFQRPANDQALMVIVRPGTSTPSARDASPPHKPDPAPSDASMPLHESEPAKEGLATQQLDDVTQEPPAPNTEDEAIGSPAPATDSHEPEQLNLAVTPARPGTTWGFGLKPRPPITREQNPSGIQTAQQIELRKSLIQAQLLSAIGQLQTAWRVEDGAYTCVLVLHNGFTQGDIHCEPAPASVRVLASLSRVVPFSRDNSLTSAERCLQFRMPEGSVTDMACQPTP